MIYINARFLSQRITGVQRYAVEISRRLMQLNNDITFIAPPDIIQKEIAELLQVKQIGTHTGHLWEQIDLPAFLKKEGMPLLLNLCNTAPLFYLNSIVTIHDLAFLENPAWFSKSFYWSYRFLIPLIARRSKKVITVSQFSKEEIVNKLNVDPSRIEVVFNGVDSRFKKSKHFLYKPYVLFVGSMDPRKNMHRLIESVKFLPSGINVKIVGGNAQSFSSKVKLSDQSKERIQFLGYVSDEELVKLYRESICFVYPSLYEGFGIPPLEAQAGGVPVVVSDIPVFREVFGTSAYFCNPEDPMDIANCIQKVSALNQDERGERIKMGMENLDRFSWDKSAKNINDIIRQY